MSDRSKNKGYFIILLILGALGGTFIGDILGKKFTALSILGNTYSIGFKNPVYIDLNIIKFTFGVVLDVNIMTIISIIVVIILFRNN
ncbi:MAG: DUF4321 domain-containing protein [Clostridiaceae bacterium]